MKKTNIFKRTFTLLVACVLIASCSVALTSCLESIFGRSSTEDEESGLSFYKTADKDGYYVQGGTSRTEYVIPAEFDGKPVIGIVENGFSGNNYTSITVPDTLTYVAPGGLSYVKSCKYNEYEGAYYLGNENNPYVVLVYAFDSNVTVADSCRTIIDNAISNSVCSLTIPASVKYISNNAFGDAYAFTETRDGVKGVYGFLKVSVDEDNENYKTIDDVMLLNKSGTRLLCLCPHAGMKIPSTVEFVEKGALVGGYDYYISANDDGNTYIASEDNPYFLLRDACSTKYIPDGVKVIGPYACQNGDYSIPSSVVQTMPKAFANYGYVVSIDSDGWFLADDYMDGLAYDMAIGGYSDGSVFWAKEGEWDEIVEEDPAIDSGLEYRRYED